MRLRAGGVRTRLFLTCWLVYSVHFATNIVREHYPAFSLAERGTLRVDPYVGLHDDIFELPGRGAFINSNPGASIIAAIPYALARPGVDAVVGGVNAARARRGETAAPSYNHPRSDYREFVSQVRARNLDIRFGLAAWIIQLLCMAPLTAASVVVMRNVLSHMGFGTTRSLVLALLYAFGTPVFLRTGFLNQNLMVAAFAFFAFALLLRADATAGAPKRQVAAGMLMGLTVLCDYSGLAVMVALGAYALWQLCRRVSSGEALMRVGRVVGGAALPIAMLLGYQAWAFGHPLYPAQHYMPPSEFSASGWSGFTGPTVALLYANLFDPTFGLFVFCPLLLLAFAAPLLALRARSLVGSPELALVFAVFFGVWIFCSSTPYAWWQWETGVRYLVPSVPFLFLAAATALVSLPRMLAWVIALAAVAQSWCLAMVREDIGTSVRMVIASGPRLPWLTAIGRVEGYGGGALRVDTLSPTLLLLAVGAAIALLWLPFVSGQQRRLIHARDTSRRP